MSATRDLMMSALVPVADFLGKNYPCGCDKGNAAHPDDDCPGEIYEAEEVIRIVLDSIDVAGIWNEGHSAGLIDGIADEGPLATNPYKETR